MSGLSRHTASPSLSIFRGKSGLVEDAQLVAACAEAHALSGLASPSLKCRPRAGREHQEKMRWARPAPLLPCPSRTRPAKGICVLGGNWAPPLWPLAPSLREWQALSTPPMKWKPPKMGAPRFLNPQRRKSRALQHEAVAKKKLPRQPVHCTL